jgi:hypothetical protein
MKKNGKRFGRLQASASAGGAESMMLSTLALRVSILSVRAESIIISMPPAESMILSPLQHSWRSSFYFGIAPITLLNNIVDATTPLPVSWQSLSSAHK